MNYSECSLIITSFITLYAVFMGWLLSTFQTKKQKNKEKELIRREKAEYILILISELEIEIKKLNELEDKKKTMNQDDLIFNLKEIGKSSTGKIKKIQMLSDLYFIYIFENHDDRFEIFHDFYVSCSLSSYYEDNTTQLLKLFEYKDKFFSTILEIKEILIEKYKIILASDPKE